MCCAFGGILLVIYATAWRRFKHRVLGMEEVNPAEWRLEYTKD